MITEKNKNKKDAKIETKFDSERPKEKQAPNKTSPKSSKEETYETNKNEIPRSKI